MPRRFGDPGGTGINSKLAAVLTLVVLGLSGLALSARLAPSRPRIDPASLIDPRRVHDDGYVGSDACRSCHPDQHASWHASYHRTMTQVASPQSVEAPFDGTELHLEGVTWQLQRRGDAFWVRGVEPVANTDEVRVLEKRVVMTTGSHNYQMYWLQGDAAGMIPFPLVFLLYDRVWIPRKSRFLMPPAERTPFEVGRWSVHCIKCHATRGQPRHPPDGETRVAELGIGCEACHGPGAEHSDRNRSPLRRFRLHWSDAPDPSIVNPERLSHERSTQVCAQCHAIEVFLSAEAGEEWRRSGSRYRPGDDLTKFQTLVSGRYEDNPPDVRAYIDEHRNFALRNCFWSDGMLRVTGREYHGMAETPCYQRGEMGCISCHAPHRSKHDARAPSVWADDQLSAAALGDGACLQCHPRYEEPEALTAHTHHVAQSAGSRCYNCHMPYTSWGLLRAVRSHTVDSPDVAASVETGRPNACNQCHLDRTLRWSAERLAEWYGVEVPDLSEDERTIAASAIWTLSGDPVQRALMAWSMGWDAAREVSGGRWMVPYLSRLLEDPYAVVRFRAQRSLRLFPEYEAITLDSVTGATKKQQQEMMRRILDDWTRSFPGSGARSGSRLLIGEDGRIDRARFSRLSALRNDDRIVLFE